MHRYIFSTGRYVRRPVVMKRFQSTTVVEEKNSSFALRMWTVIRSKLTIVHFARAARVGFLGVALYQAGYQAGLITYAQDPHKIEKEMMKGVVAATGAKSYHPVHHPYHMQVKRVGDRLIFAAKDMCKEKLERLQEENKALDKEILANNQNTKTKEAAADSRHKNFELREKLFQNNEEINQWETALSRLKGSWHYIVIDVPSVNAFVTAACPRNIFVHSGLLQKLDPTDDELALIMGHELSHFLLQHVEKEQTFDVSLKILQLILLTFVEPIGLFSLGYDYMVGKVAQYLDAAYSRECEEEADTLGIELTARACFDINKSIQVFEKLHNELDLNSLPQTALPNPVNLESEATPTAGKTTKVKEKKNEHKHAKKHAAWGDSHPSWDDRIDNITALTEKHHTQKYRTCQSYLRHYMDSFVSTLGIDSLSGRK